VVIPVEGEDNSSSNGDDEDGSKDEDGKIERARVM
jgi:hypothetical protein